MKIIGMEVQIESNASLNPKYKARPEEPMTLKREIRTMAVFIPSNCWSWVGSLAIREVSAPVEFSSLSW